MIRTALLLPLVLTIVGAVPAGKQLAPRGGCGNPHTVTVSTAVTRTTSRGSNTSSPPTLPSTQTSASTPPASSSGATNPPSNGGTPPANGYRNVLYFTNWGVYGANYQPSDLPADKVTHLLYSFADIASDGEVKSSDAWSDTDYLYPGDQNTPGHANGCVKQIYALKKQNRKMKVVLSIGGWTWSYKFVPVAATEAGRRRFATSAVKLMADWGMDGLDIDWEYPSSAKQASDFVALLKACREELDKYAAQNAPGYHFVLTVACPAGPTHYQQMDLRGMDPYVDAWHLMAYDYAGSWDTTTGHQANLFFNPAAPQATKFSTEVALTYYLAQGIRSDKIVLGMPLYGRSFLNTDGIGLPYSGVGQGSLEAGVWHYKVLPRPGATETFDERAGAVYSYDPTSRELVTYDNVLSANFKTNYLKNKGLGGAVYWEAAGDRKGEGSIVGAVAANMASLDSTQNLLSYPTSQYVNIRNNLA
ncbi:Endochitinase B1-like protein 1 [Colletotrichum truncatum]|uniref:Endochitinase B1-like protein 1 n=1 Tax=Colletotrichum truncatum TaxID=5467 RepID=A0ACC3Z479_COLTU|nr:Endochitinase B1-like protein 1 [Colletotrichum truncatum]KAF6795730.1 Endochitinase B1-like protein 1 [Colletotrichum truncatum]